MWPISEEGQPKFKKKHLNVKTKGQEVSDLLPLEISLTFRITIDKFESFIQNETIKIMG